MQAALTPNLLLPARGQVAGEGLTTGPCGSGMARTLTKRGKGHARQVQMGARVQKGKYWAGPILLKQTGDLFVKLCEFACGRVLDADLVHG